jgi:hypothetical protein
MRITEREDGRRVIAINTTIDLDAYELLCQFSPTPRAHGRFLSRLIYEHQARWQERERFRQQVAGEVGANHVA